MGYRDGLLIGQPYLTALSSTMTSMRAYSLRKTLLATDDQELTHKKAQQVGDKGLESVMRDISLAEAPQLAELLKRHGKQKSEHLDYELTNATVFTVRTQNSKLAAS